MQIRPAISDDVPAVLPMVQRICAMHENWDPAKYAFLPDPAEMYRSWLCERANDPRSVFLVTVREDRIIGFVVATIEKEIPIYRLEEFAFIHDLWVDPDYRNEGVGRQMTMLTIEQLSKMGIEQVRLDTAAVNEPARALFKSCGFRVSTLEMLLEISK